MFGKLLFGIAAVFGLVSSMSMPPVSDNLGQLPPRNLVPSTPVTSYKVDICPEYNQLVIPVQNRSTVHTVITTCPGRKLKSVLPCNEEDEYCILIDRPLEDALTSNLGMNKDFCIGWNVNDNCDLDKEIPIVHNKFFQIDCKDCMFGFSGGVVFELDIFKREMTVGFENMLFGWSIVIDGLIGGSWATSFTKTYNTEVKTIVNTHVGLIPIDITVELPVQVNFAVSSKADLSGEIGIQSQGILGNLLSIYDKGKWSHQYPEPTWKFTKLINGKVDESLEVTVEIIPSLILQVDSLFEGTLDFDLKADLSEEFDGKLQACIDEETTLEWKGEAKLSWFHFDKTFDDIIYQKSIKGCSS